MSSRRHHSKKNLVTSSQKEPSMNLNDNNNMSTLNATLNGAAVRRIRTPHAHDVLSGRGGGINGHVGNVHFRELVSVRKEDYNLAKSKVEKARVARDIIALVRQQDPPGRFLQKDPTAGIGNWWVELDEDRVVAKTSQALREGAPMIRAAHQEEIDEAKHNSNNKHNNTRKVPKTIPNKAVFVTNNQLKRPREATQWPAPVTYNSVSNVNSDVEYQEKAMMELRSNVEHARLRNDLLENDPVIRFEKRMRMDEVGNSAPAPLSTPSRIPRQRLGLGQRQNSLALSEVSFDADEMGDFVNPFSDEMEENIEQLAFMESPKYTSLLRQDSTASIDSFSGQPMPPAVPLQRSMSRNTSSVATRMSKLDWDDSDPLFTYLASLEPGTSSQ